MSRLAEALTWERSRVGGHDLLTLVKIADLTDDEGRNAWPEVPYLMEKCRMKERRTQYVLRRLVAKGEIEIEINAEGREITLRGGRKFRPKWFIHVLCVCAWAKYQRGWKPAKVAGFKRGRPKRKPADIADSRKHEIRKKRRRNPHGGSAKSANPSSAYKEGSLSDPLVDQKQGAAPPTALPKDNLNVITVLAHTVLDSLGLPNDNELGEYGAVLKQACASEKILYDSDVVRKALDSAIWQRQHPERRRA